MALCVLAAAWKKAVGRKAEEDESVAPGFVHGLLGVVVDHGLRLESAQEAQLVRDRVHAMGKLMPYNFSNLLLTVLFLNENRFARTCIQCQ